METTRSTPYVFDEFFASGKEESISPFLIPATRTWGKNLPLKASFAAAFFLLVSFILSFYAPILSDLFLLAVYFLVGTPALIDTLEDMRNLEINIDVLMTLAALLSVLIGSGMEGALLLVLFELSAAMENTVTHKTKGALSHLNQLSPTRAYTIDPEGNALERSVREISVGTYVLVKAGEIVPLDGKVIKGKSFVNLSHLTGESLPVAKGVGDEVQAGARNLEGTLTIEVIRTSADSTLSRIIQLITQAQEAKPQLQRFIDRFGKRYATTIILLSFTFALSLPWLMTALPYLGKEGSIYRALTFLIAASPCALVIATPTAYLSAISSCAKKGILLKGGIILDALSKCSAVAFDKTGTLTTGKLTLVFEECLSDPSSSYDAKTALSLAASLETHVVHPIADAIVSYAKMQNTPLTEVYDFVSSAGFGVKAKAKIQGKEILCFVGHYEYVASQFPPKLKADPNLTTPPAAEQGKVSTYLLAGDSLYCFRFTDELRHDTLKLLNVLKQKLKMQICMLTGDHKENADAVARQVGIDAVYADLRPEHKLEKVSALSAEKGLIMVGDGVNDAPALMRATVGISLGKIGSATAIDASDVVFLQDDISLLDWLIRKSHHTMQIVKQNLTLALSVILLATTPALLGFIPLWVAVILHEGGTVLVGLNSLRLLKK